MNKLNWTTLLVALLANLCLIDCLDNETSPSNNPGATVSIVADKEAYNPGQQVKVDVSFK